MLILDSNNTILNEIRGGNGKYAYNSNAGIHEINETIINFRFNNCFVINMELGYSEAYGIQSAYFFHIYQTIIMDKNFNPLFITWIKGEGVS